MKDIDIKEVIRQKSPRGAKLVPGFVVNYLQRIVHQDEINDILHRFGGLEGVEFVREVLRYKGFSFNVKGLDELPADGRFIFSSNHPLGGLDGLMLIDVVSSHYDKVRVVVNDILTNIPPLKPLFVPVNKHGSQSSDNARAIREMYLSDAQIIYFPAGLCSRKTKGKIADPPWKKSFVAKAVESGRDIVPVFVGGRNSNFFYNLSNFRQALHIPFNIEMLYLVDEFFRQKQNRIDIVFGRPVPCADLRDGRPYQEWTQVLRGMTYDLDPARQSAPSR